MPRTLRALCFFVLLCCSTFLSAQQTDPVVGSFLRSSLASLTGSTVINDVSLSGSAECIRGAEDSLGSVELVATATGFSQLSLDTTTQHLQETASQTTVRPFGYWVTDGGAKHAIPLHNLFNSSAWFFPAYSLSKMLSTGASVTYLGKETVGGEVVLHFRSVQITQQNLAATDPVVQQLSQTELFLNATTLLPSELSFNTHPDDDAGTDIPIRIRFSEYRVMNGVKTPFRIQKLMNGALALDIHLQSATFNTGVGSVPSN